MDIHYLELASDEVIRLRIKNAGGLSIEDMDLELYKIGLLIDKSIDSVSAGKEGANEVSKDGRADY